VAIPGSDDLDLLAALSLVSLIASEGAGDGAPRVRVHPLLRDLAREELARQPEPMRSAVLHALLLGVSELIGRHRTDFAALGREEALLAGTLHRAGAASEAPAIMSATIAALDSYVDLGGHWRLGGEWATLRLTACQRAGDQAGEGSARNNQGYLAYRLGRNDEARAHYIAALDLRRAAGDRAGEAETLNNLGALMAVASRREEAAAYYEQALAIRRAIGDRAGEGTTLNNLGGLSTNLGRPDEARRFYEQALAIAHEVENPAGEGAILSNLGLLARSQLRRQEARRYFEQALPLQSAVGDRMGEAATLHHLGLLSFADGRDAEARGELTRALAILAETGPAEAAQVVRQNLAELGEVTADELAASQPASAVMPATPLVHVPPVDLSPPNGPISIAPLATPQAPPPVAEAKSARRWWPWGRR
jgi:tetratricopeptide (TPR) repeat protein